MTEDSDRNESSLENRIERLERSIATLHGEIAAIRATLDTDPSRHARLANAERSRPGRDPARPTESSGSARRLRPRYLGEQIDLERLLGRYGMLGIAVLAAAAAVGTFLSWAISRGYLTLSPTARIVVGLLFAAGIAMWGFRLRKRERSFGSSLLGLSLVIILVCAYAAGPGLAVVPEWSAFGGAIAVSWALAVFARREGDEPLWCVAFAGAAIAPYVTSSGKGNLYGLVVYAASVLIAGCFAINDRPWRLAWRIYYSAATLLVVTATGVARAHGLSGFLFAIGLPVSAALGGVLPFAPDSRKRAALRWLFILASFTGYASPFGRSVAPFVGGALFLILALWLTILDRVSRIEQSSVFEANQQRTALLDWVDAMAIPISFAFQTSVALRQLVPLSRVYAAVGAALLIFLWRRELGATRDAAVAACLIVVLAALYALHPESPTGEVLGLLIIGLAALTLHVVRPSVSWVVGSVILILGAASVSTVALTSRTAYNFTPFGTEPSLAALFVTAGLVTVARFRGRLRAAMEAVRLTGDADLAGRSVAAAPWVWAFWWGFLELAMAFSRSTSTLLLVVYFAACGVAGVAIGHQRQSPGTRKTGLALALLAAATAVYGATSFFVVGTRVLAYLVISAFLLGIAYWYRRPGDERPVSEASAVR